MTSSDELLPSADDSSTSKANRAAMGEGCDSPGRRPREGGQDADMKAHDASSTSGNETSTCSGSEGCDSPDRAAAREQESVQQPAPQQAKAQHQQLAQAAAQAQQGSAGGPWGPAASGGAPVSASIPPEAGAAAPPLNEHPVSPAECNLFVGDLARGLTEEDLLTAFSKHGRVLTVNIKRDRATNKNLGYGFVRMSTHAEACVAKDRMHRSEVHGRRLRVGWAQKNATLAVTGLPAGVTLEQLLTEFQPFGIVEEDGTRVTADGSALVKFRSRLQAEEARRQMNGTQALGASPVRVDWSMSASGIAAQQQVKAGHKVGREANAPPPCRVQVMLEGEAAANLQEVEETVLRLFQDFAPLVSVSAPRAEARTPAVGPKSEKSDAGSASPSGTDGAASATTAGTASPTDSIGARVRAAQKAGKPMRAYCAVTFPPTRAGQARALAAMAAINGTVTATGLKVTCSIIRSDARQHGRSVGPGGAAGLHGYGGMPVHGGNPWHVQHHHAAPLHPMYYMRAPFEGVMREQQHAASQALLPGADASPAAAATVARGLLEGPVSASPEARGARGDQAAQQAYSAWHMQQAGMVQQQQQMYPVPTMYGAGAAAGGAGSSPDADAAALAYYSSHAAHVGYFVPVAPGEGQAPMVMMHSPAGDSTGYGANAAWYPPHVYNQPVASYGSAAPRAQHVQPHRHHRQQQQHQALQQAGASARGAPASLPSEG